MGDPAVPKQPVWRKVPSRVPDYNPDKERHTDHSFIVLDATKKRRSEIDLGNIKIPLKNGRAVIKDEALARELQQEHRWDATVSRVRTPKPADRGHRYHFGQMPAMPWHKYDENGKRIVAEPKTEESKESEAEHDLHPEPTKLPSSP